MNRKFVSKSNFVLRKVLNSKDNLDILQDFIEAILKIKIKKITLNPYLKSKEKYLPQEENFGIADVRITMENDKELNVGIQMIDGYYIQNKVLLYYAQIHTNQLEHDENRKIVDTVTINIIDFPYLPSKNYHQIIEITDEKRKEKKDNENIKLHIIELSKFKTILTRKLTREEKWVNYLVGNEFDREDEENTKISKLDDLLENYWKEEKME